MKLFYSSLLLLVLVSSCSRKNNAEIERLKRDIRTNDYLIKMYEEGLENRRRWRDSVNHKKYKQIIAELKESNKVKSDSILLLQGKR